MNYYIGIDGGGTKTAFVIGKDEGTPIKIIEKSGCSHKSIGIDNVINLLTDGVREIIQSVNISIDECMGCCIGLPCYGEAPDADLEITERLKSELSPIFALSPSLAEMMTSVVSSPTFLSILSMPLLNRYVV